MAVYYLNNGASSWLTPATGLTDLVLLSNVYGYTDGGFVTTPPEGSATQLPGLITFLEENSSLTVGGNYDGQANISFIVATEDLNTFIDPYINVYNKDVFFHGNGKINITAATGAALANYKNTTTGELKSDAAVIFETKILNGQQFPYPLQMKPPSYVDPTSWLSSFDNIEQYAGNVEAVFDLTFTSSFVGKYTSFVYQRDAFIADYGQVYSVAGDIINTIYGMTNAAAGSDRYMDGAAFGTRPAEFIGDLKINGDFTADAEAFVDVHMHTYDISYFTPIGNYHATGRHVDGVLDNNKFSVVSVQAKNNVILDTGVWSGNMDLYVKTDLKVKTTQLTHADVYAYSSSVYYNEAGEIVQPAKKYETAPQSDPNIWKIYTYNASLSVDQFTGTDSRLWTVVADNLSRSVAIEAGLGYVDVGDVELVDGKRTVKISDMDGVINTSVSNINFHAETANPELFYMATASTSLAEKSWDGTSWEEVKDEKGNPVYEQKTDADGNPVFDDDGKPVLVIAMQKKYTWETKQKAAKDLSQQERYEIYNAEIARIQKELTGGKDGPMILEVSVILENNLFEAAAVVGNKLEIDRVREDAVITVATDNNSITYEHNSENENIFQYWGSDAIIHESHMFDAYTKSDSTDRTETIRYGKNNQFRAVGFLGNTMVNGRFDGTLNVSANNNFTPGQAEYVTARGFTSWNMTATHNIGGNVNLSLDGNAFTNNWGPIFRNRIDGVAIQTENVMHVTGRLDTNIYAYLNDGTTYGDVYQINGLMGIAAGYQVRSYDGTPRPGEEGVFEFEKYAYHGEMYVDAITSDISLNIGADTLLVYNMVGITVGKALVSESLATDSVDITGNIELRRDGALYGNGIYSTGTVNIRIAGSISAGNVVVASNAMDSTQRLAYEKYAEENGSWNNETWLKYANASTFYDVVEFASTAVTVGDVSLDIGKNEIIYNSGAKVNGLMIATGGTINFKFMLDGVPATHSVVTANGADGSLQSTATFTINMNNAFVGGTATYTLYSYTGDINLAYTNWTSSEKKISFVYHGETKEFTLKELDKGFTCEFSDGASAKVFYDVVNSQFKVTTDNIKALSGFNREFTNTLLPLSSAVKISWSGHSSILAVDNSGYQIEYWIYDENGNRGNSIVTTVSNKQLTYGGNNMIEYIIPAVNPGQKIDYRVRYYEGIDSNYSNWSAVNSITADKLAVPKIEMVGNTPFVSSANESGAGITDAVAFMRWGDAKGTNISVKSYNVEYFITDNEIMLTDDEYEAGITLEEKVMQILAEKAAKGELYSKNTTAPEVYASGLINRSFVYWRVQAVGYIPVTAEEYIDIPGEVTSDWRLGEIFRVYDNDITKPNFIERNDGLPVGNIYAQFDRTNPKDVKLDVVIGWMEAADSQSGVKQYVIEYKLVDQDWAAASRVIIPKGTNGGATYDYEYYLRLDGGLYNFRVVAVDYAGNQSDSAINQEFAYGSSDLKPPTGSFLSFDPAVINTVWLATNVDEEGKPVTGGDGWFFEMGGGGITGGGGSGGTAGAKQAESQTITLSWKDNYEDEAGVKYKFLFSNKINDFSAGGTISSDAYYVDMGFILANETTGKKSVTIGNNVVGLDLGSVYKLANANNGTVYWSIMAVDGNNNATGDWSSVNTFTISGEDRLTLENIANSASVNPSNLSATKVTLTEDGNYLATDDSGNLIEKPNSNIVQFTWTAASTFFGVADYIITLTDKNTGRTQTITWGRGDDGVTSTGDGDAELTDFSYTIPNILDGSYSWTVTADVALGNNLSTKGNDFIIDTIAPTWNDIGLNLVRRTYNSDLVWNFASDANGVAKYIVQFCALSGLSSAQINDQSYGWNTGVEVKGDLNKVMLPFLSTESYKVRVIAVDNYGNQRTSSQVIFDATTIVELPDNPAEAPVIIDATTPAGQHIWGWSNAAVDQTVGIDDKADCVKINSSSSFAYSEIKLDLKNITVLEGSNANLKITIHNADNGKKLKAFTFKPGYSAGYYNIVPGKINTNNFYLMIESSGKKSQLYYGLDVTLRELPVNNADDYWKNNSYVDARTTIISNSRSTVSPTAIGTTDWVGYGDKLDYWKVDFLAAGNYSFNLSIANNAIDINNLQLTVYSIKYDKYGNEKSISKAVTVSLKGVYDKVTKSWVYSPVATKDKLLEAGSYYVMVSAPGASKGLGADYAVSVSGSAYIKGFNGDDNKYSEWVADNAVTLNGGINTIDSDDWVGFGDSIDYRKLNVLGDGEFSFTLGGGVSDKVKFTLYQDLGGGKVKKITSFTSTGPGTSKTVILTAGTYFTEVVAVNAKKAGNTSYTLYSSGDYYNPNLILSPAPQAPADDTWQDARAFDPILDGALAEGTIAGGDAADFFKLSFDSNGTLELSGGLTDMSNIDLELVDSNGTSLSLVEADGVWRSENALMAGTDYYLGVNAKDADKQETNYGFAVTLKNV